MNDKGFDQPSPVVTDTNTNYHRNLREILKSNPEILDQKDKKYIGNLLKKWQNADDNCDKNLNEPGEDFWDQIAFDSKSELSLISIPNSFVFQNSSYEEYSNSKGIKLLNQLSQDKNFDQKDILANYLAYEIWFTKQPMEIGSTLTTKQILEKVEEAKKLLYPPLQEITINLLHEKNQKGIEKFMNYLYSANQSDFAEKIIIDPRLNIQERTDFMVSFMNSFGVISGIKLLNSKIDEHPDIKKVYEIIQGKNIEKIYKNLQCLYSEINFDNFFINTSEFTEKELNLIKQQINDYCQRTNQDSKSINILDIGAGTGRHSVPLFQEGYQVTALELQDNHVQTIRQKAPGIQIIQQDWLKLELNHKIDFAYCLERSALHNQTPSDMLKFFDNISSSLEKNGTLLIDFADTSIGEYQSKVDQFKQNLIKIGVKESKIQYIFDGVDEKHQFNRMAPTKEQIKIYAKLTGLKMVSSNHDSVEDISNTYYIFTKDPNLYPDDDSIDNLQELLLEIGLYGKDVDYNQFIKSWEMSIGQALIYGLDNDLIRTENLNGNICRISTVKRGDSIFLETTRPY